MRQLFLAIALLTSALVLLPPASAECSPTDPTCWSYPCNVAPNACDPPTITPYVRKNQDGSTEIGYTECSPSCSDHKIVRIPAAPDLPTVDTYSRHNASDNSTTYGVTVCRPGCTSYDVVTIPGHVTPPTACFAYNPNALTNACVTIGSTIVVLPLVSPTTTPTPVCVIGPECVTVPVPGVAPNPTPVNVPTIAGYVEATAACGVLGPICRVDF